MNVIRWQGYRVWLSKGKYIFIENNISSYGNGVRMKVVNFVSFLAKEIGNEDSTNRFPL